MKDQHVRTLALKAIQAAFEMETVIKLEVEAIRTKIQSFRNIFSREMGKVLSSEKSGSATDDLYRPTYPHFAELSFLQRVIKKRSSKSNVDEESFSQSQRQSHTQSDNEEEENQDPLIWTSQSQNGDNILVYQNMQTRREAIPASSVNLTRPSLSPQNPSNSTFMPTITRNLHESNGKKRKSTGDGEMAMAKIGNYFEHKITAAHADNDDKYNVWAKSMVCNLKEINCVKKRSILMINTQRLIQDEILKQHEESVN